ncbi:MAG: sarcosine oxidase subunit gamma [Woeseiaceae bacterium]
MSEQRTRVSIVPGTGFINLRGDSQNADFLNAAEVATGQRLPVKANTISEGELRVYWLGPDEWLLVCPAEKVADVISQLNEKLSGLHVAVNDISGGNTGMHLSGESVRALFSKGCTLDFHPKVFKAGDCAQSGLAKASVLIGLIEGGATFELIVRRSFAGYMLNWLRHAGREYGIEFT